MEQGLERRNVILGVVIHAAQNKPLRAPPFRKATSVSKNRCLISQQLGFRGVPELTQPLKQNSTPFCDDIAPGLPFLIACVSTFLPAFDVSLLDEKGTPQPRLKTRALRSAESRYCEELVTPFSA